MPESPSHRSSYILGEQVAGPVDVEAAISAAHRSREAVQRVPKAERARVLDQVASSLEADEALPARLSREADLTLRDMRGELVRTVETLRFASAEVRSRSEAPPVVDAAVAGGGRVAHLERVPLGVILGITPFNGPILTATHKIAPAVAIGAPIIIKPSPYVASSAADLCAQFVDAGWPAEAIASLDVGNDETVALVEDDRIAVVSFTGGPIGWELKSRVPRKRVHLELGGVGTVVIHRDAPLIYAADRVAMGAFVRSGQSCLSVQAVLAHEQVHDEFVRLLADRVEHIVHGPSNDEATVVAPLRTDQAADRVASLIHRTNDRGGITVVGGGREGRLIAPTLLSHVPLDAPLLREEAFGPVVAVAPFSRDQDVAGYFAASDGALNVGVFTDSIDTAFGTYHTARAGAVIINDVNTWRVDNMPYGGVGTGGFGREGLRYAIEEFSELKLLVINQQAWQQTP